MQMTDHKPSTFDIMNVIVLKSKVNSVAEELQLEATLKSISYVSKWSLDLEDIDKILRVETLKNVEEHVFANHLIEKGVKCELLPD